jgi:hypothetical protein
MTQGLAAAAQQIQGYGRGNDKMLAHITPSEAQFVDYMQGGRRINPMTGLPEYGLFGKVLKGLARAAGAAVGFTLGGPAGAALGAGLATKATGGSWKDAAIGAALAGGGAWAGNALSGAGTGLTTGASYGPLAGGASSAGSAASGLAGVSDGMSAFAPSAGAASAPMSLGGLGSATLATVKAAPLTYAGLAATEAMRPNTMSSKNAGPPEFFPQQQKQPTLAEIDTDLRSRGITGQRRYVPYTGDPYNYRGHRFFENVAPANMADGGAVLPPQQAVQYGLAGYSMGMKRGGTVAGPGAGKDDKIPAMLSDGEHIIDAATVSDLGDGSNEAGHRRIEELKRLVREGAGRKNPKKPTNKQRGLGTMLMKAKAA